MTFSNWYWQTIQNFRLRLSTKTWILLRFYCKEILHSANVIKTKVLISIFYLYCCHQPIQISPLKKYDGKRGLVPISELGNSKIVFTQLNKIIMVYVRLIFIKVQDPELETLFSGLSKFFQVIGDLTSKTVLRICCRLFFVYLGTWEITKVGFRVKEPDVDLIKRPDGVRAKNPSFLSLLGI